MASLYNIEIEKHVLSCLLQYPDVWSEFSLVSSKDFSSINKPIFEIIKKQLDETPPQPITTIILVEKLKSFNINIESIDPYVYLEALKLKAVSKEETKGLIESLKKITVKRELIEKCRETEKKLNENPIDRFDEMVKIMDTTLSSVNTNYFKSDVTDLFSNIIDIVEERGNNPIDADDLGFMGPFPSVNQTLGALSFPGSFTVIGARTGGGKSSLSFYYNLYLAEKYNLPILHLDANEMTLEQLQMRAICCLSNGRIPLWAVKSGEWRKNKEWCAIIRDDIWPRVKKIKIYFQNIGNMSGDEIVTFIKRFYFKKIGRGNHLLINLDYIKGSEAFSAKVQEYQSIGHYINNLKNLITDQITGSIWTSVQNNRTGIITGKKSDDIQDSEESFSLSDRIIQQATHGFVMRWKVPEELARELNKFGNVKLSPVKTRESLGKQFEKSLRPIRTPEGKYVKNYFNLNTHDFYYEDKGDLVSMLDVMGHNIVNFAKPSNNAPNNLL